jgi:hypothetical protein
MGLLALAAARPSAGATLSRVTVDQMLGGAELIFEGRVVTTRTRSDADTGHPQTCARFAVLEVLKGSLAGPTVELCFAGGVAGAMRMEVPGLILPRPGERGIYFVASRSRGYWNPLYGWDQGHFLIEPEAAGGAPIVKTARRRPVLDLERGEVPQELELSSGFARGVHVGERAGDAAQAHVKRLSPRAFKGRVRRLLLEREP